MTDRENTASLNYEAEAEHLKAELEEVRHDLNSLEILNRSYEQELNEKDKKIAFLEGQIKAFQFCIARGNLKNDR